MADIVYFNGQYLDRDQVRISPNDRGWLLADGVYEAAPAYRGRFLRLDRHLDRLASSAAKIRIEGAEQDELARVPAELLVRNGFKDEPRVLAYFQITRGVAPRSHAFPHPSVRPTVYAYVNPFRLKVNPAVGATAITRPDVRWGRCDIKSIALLANVLANQEAQEAGVYESIFVRDGAAQEGTHTNLFVVTGGAIRTPPLTHFVLPGITREIVIELARDLGIPVREEPIT